MKTAMFFAGVGGQGTLLASQVVGQAALDEGVQVLMSEVHGMAQRGGVVTCTVVLGDAHSPLVGEGGADILLGFEPIETLRAIDRANKDTWIITSTSPIVPFTASVGEEKYPEVDDVVAALKEASQKVVTIDSLGLAQQAGAAISANVVMLGALSATPGFSLRPEAIVSAFDGLLPKKAAETNKKAFELGREEAMAQMG